MILYVLKKRHFYSRKKFLYVDDYATDNCDQPQVSDVYTFFAAAAAALIFFVTSRPTLIFVHCDALINWLIALWRLINLLFN